MIPVLIKRLKSNKLFYILVICLLLSVVGCSNAFDKEETEEEKVELYLVYPDQSPVQGFPVTLAKTGESAHQMGIVLESTDKNGKTEATLTVGATYEAYIVIDDDTTQYEEFTVSENAEDNEFTFILDD